MKSILMKLLGKKSQAVLCVLAMFAVIANVGRASPLPAFPGAEGYGAIAVGDGRHR